MDPDDTNSGAGTGGGPDAKFHDLSHDGRFSISANQVLLTSRPSLAPVVPDPYVITILAAGMGMDGIVTVRLTRRQKTNAVQWGHLTLTLLAPGAEMMQDSRNLDRR